MDRWANNVEMKFYGVTFRYLRNSFEFLLTYRQGVKYSPNDGEQEYRSQMVEE